MAAPAATSRLTVVIQEPERPVGVFTRRGEFYFRFRGLLLPARFLRLMDSWDPELEPLLVPDEEGGA